jgi:hypothetical protein
MSTDKLPPDTDGNESFGLTDEEYGFPQDDIGGGGGDDEDNGNSKGKSKRRNRDSPKDINPKRAIVAYKYSNKGKSLLHEAIIIAGQPAFLKYESGGIIAVQYIEEPNRIIKPPNPEEYPYETYEFENTEEIQSYLEKSRSESIGSLYNKAKSIVGKYNDQDPNIITLLAADIVWSYFQDIFSTTHYIDIVGENDGYTFEYTGYRPVRGTGISAANYYRTLGTEEPGQCTIIEDEGDHIDQDPEKMAILKSGYELMAKVPKINMNSIDQKPRWYYAYCFKIIIAEKSLDPYKAKGLADRTLTFHCKPGKIKQRYSIKEVINYRNNNGKNNNYNFPKQQLHNELIDFRRLMLCYRLLHYEDTIVDIQIGLKNRDVELCGPLLQLFYGSDQVISDIVSALGKFLEEKKEKKVFGLEASLYPLILNLVSRHGYELAVSQIWSEMIDNFEGSYDDEKPNQFQTDEYGILYKNTMTKIIVDKFGSGRKKKNTGNAIVFSKEKLQRFAEAYSTKVSIRIALEEEDGNGGSGSSGGILDHLSDKHSSNRANNNDNSNITQETNNSKVNNSDTSLTAPALPHQVKDNQNVDLHRSEPPHHPQLPPAVTEDSSSNINSGIINKGSIYRIGYTDIWACRKCNLQGDKWYMRQHIGRGMIEWHNN